MDDVQKVLRWGARKGLSEDRKQELALYVWQLSQREDLNTPLVVRGYQRNARLNRKRKPLASDTRASLFAETRDPVLARDMARAAMTVCDSERDWDIVRLRWLNDWTLEEVAEQWRVTRERVRQLESALKDRFRAYFARTHAYSSP